MIIELKILDHLKNNPVFADGGELQQYRDHGPVYAHPGDAGLDIRACITEPLTIYPGESRMIETGLAAWIGSHDMDFLASNTVITGLIVPRSGLGSKKGIVIGNLTGVVDEGYTGEIMISVWNRTTENPYTIQPGEKICQMMFVPVFQAGFKIVDEFIDSTTRGANGFGSSGK